MAPKPVLGIENFQKHLAMKSNQTVVHSRFRTFQLELSGRHFENSMLSLS